MQNHPTKRDIKENIDNEKVNHASGVMIKKERIRKQLLLLDKLYLWETKMRTYLSQ